LHVADLDALGSVAEGDHDLESSDRQPQSGLAIRGTGQTPNPPRTQSVDVERLLARRAGGTMPQTAALSVGFTLSTASPSARR
jgi:hypothetical protein